MLKIKGSKMKKTFLFILIVAIFAFLYIYAPIETHINGYDSYLKTLKFGNKYFTQCSPEIPSDVSFELLGNAFSSKENIEKIGGKYEVENGKVNIYYTKNRHYKSDNAKYLAKTSGKNFLVFEGGKWKNLFIKGVNIGAAKPGSFPGDLNITKEEYLRWFEYIKEMNANAIRIYTTLMPEFYEALYQFNLNRQDPLYIMHGVWVNEEDTITLLDAFAEDKKILKDFIKDGQDIVDIIHGKATLPERNGFASGVYKYDVSNYMIGWILGTEWDPYFVEGTNTNYKPQYFGEFLYTVGATPFEIFLAEVGDKIISYEYEKYSVYRPTAFSNWLTTDPLTHPNEPMEVEDMAEVDTENIKARSIFESGLFASYHIYPYYPEFINGETKYKEYTDENGEQNTYKAYLEDLIAHHTKPVIVAEFGVPASRGKAHDAYPSGFNQGNHTEAAQGEIIVELFKDIYNTGYMGGFVFSWQDEWFKKTWNTMDFEDAQGRAYWSNVQTNEQHFGLMAFDPGEKESISYPDGRANDWKDDVIFIKNDNLKLYVKSDERYVYFAIDGFDLRDGKLIIPVDSLPGQGLYSYKDYKFDRGVDFIVEIDGEENSRVLVDSYYDHYKYKYEAKTDNLIRKFNPIRLSLNRKLYFPEERRHQDPQYYETGLLMFGNGNPKDENYNSLADFYEYKDFLEIRIPWQLFNVMNPTKKWVLDNYFKHDGFVPTIVDGFMIGLESEPMRFYSWDEWDLPTYHERLKQSYYILKEFLKNFAN